MLNERLWKHGLFVFIQLHIKRRGFMKQEMSYKQTLYGDLLERFSDSGHAICEVTINDEKISKYKAADVACRIQRAAVNFGRPHIRAISYRDKLYLINKMRG